MRYIKVIEYQRQYYFGLVRDLKVGRGECDRA